MKNLLKFVIILVCLISFTVQSTKFIKTKNTFEENINIKKGDVIQCEVTNTDVAKPEKSFHTFTNVNKDGMRPYSFYAFDNYTKCLSFKVRTKCFAHIALNESPTYYSEGSRNWVETFLQFAQEPGPNTDSVIRTDLKSEAAKVRTPYILNENELRGFWIRWLDDQTIEVGHESENAPFMSYRSPTKLSIKYFGITSFRCNTEWVIYGDSKCPKTNDTKPKTETESECFILN